MTFHNNTRLRENRLKTFPMIFFTDRQTGRQTNQRTNKQTNRHCDYTTSLAGVMTKLQYP